MARKRRKYDRELYESLLAAFRDDPGNALRASRIAGCNRKTARAIWDSGWPSRDWAAPIKDVIAKEQEIARGKLLDEPRPDPKPAAPPTLDDHLHLRMAEVKLSEREDRRKAAEQAAETRAQEGKLIAGMRGVLGRNMAAIGAMQPGIVKLGAAVNDLLLRRVEEGKIDPDKAASLIRKVAGAMRDTASSLQMVLESERLYMGEPTAILGLADQFETADLQDCAAEVERAHRAVQRAKARGFIPSEAPTNGTGDGTVH